MHIDANAIKEIEQELERLNQLLAHGPTLTFQHNASVQEAKVHVTWLATLDQAWKQACAEIGEPYKPEDRLQSDTGTDMKPYLGDTILHLYAHEKTRVDKFEIAGPTGGAGQ